MKLGTSLRAGALLAVAAGCALSTACANPFMDMARIGDGENASQHGTPLTERAPDVPPGTWYADASSSYLTFSTTKQTTIEEVHTFEAFTASVHPNGTATLVVDLESVATNVDLRNERVRTYLFESHLFPAATATFPLDPAAIESIPVGESRALAVNANLDLHGVSQPLSFWVQVVRDTETKLTVATTEPIVLDALLFDLGPGIDALIQLAGLASIETSVPVEFQFTLHRY